MILEKTQFLELGGCISSNVEIERGVVFHKILF